MAVWVILMFSIMKKIPPHSANVSVKPLCGTRNANSDSRYAVLFFSFSISFFRDMYMYVYIVFVRFVIFIVVVRRAREQVERSTTKHFE